MGREHGGWIVKAVGKAYVQRPKNKPVWWFENCKLLIAEWTAKRQGVVGYLAGEIIRKCILNLKNMLWNLDFILGVLGIHESF